MKHLILLVAILITNATNAQNPTEKNIGDFKELKVYDLIEVELVKSNENKAIISGSNTQDVLLINKNGILKIRMNIGKTFDGTNTKVKLYYKSLDIIDANEGARINSKDEIKQFEIDLKAQEGGTINVNVNVNYVIVKAVTGGVIEVSGTTKKETITILTGGSFKGEKLKSEHVDVSINAAGEASVNASKVVDVKIRAGGDVFIYGNPETINESKVLGGRIKRME